MKKILIVDDEQDIQIILTNFLEDKISQETEIICASNGASACVKLHSDGPFDLIITDQKMPYMDGISLITYTRKEDSRHKQTPIILLSAFNRNVQNLLTIHENIRFMDKPIDENQFEQVVNILLK